MTANPVTAAADLLAAAGLRTDATTRARLRRALREVAAAAGLEPAAFVDRARADPAVLQRLLDRVTVQETAFFRDPEQFDLLRHLVLPDLPGRVRLWSAGCANGQEAYSLAMTLEEEGRAGSVLATDLSEAALQRTTEARYRERELRGLPGHLRRHLVRDGDDWRVVDELRRRVEVRRHNLVVDPLPFPSGTCHVVFCRNVLIYLDRPLVTRFLARLAGWLPPGGWLFLGGSETLFPLTDRFEAVQAHGAFAFRRREATVDATPPPPVPPAPPAPPRPARAARPARSRPAPAARRPDPDEALPSAAALLEQGARAAACGDHLAAIAAFRRAAYVDGDSAIAHLHLGFALDAAGDPDGARRAYAAARAALDRAGAEAVTAALEGYTPETLAALLDARLDEEGG